MSNPKQNTKRIKLLASASALGLLAAGWTINSAMADHVKAFGEPLQLLAQAQGGAPADRGGQRGGQGSGQGSGQGAGQGGQQGSGSGTSGSGRGVEDKVLRGSGQGQGGPSADSDRPDTAGVKGGKGGGGTRPTGSGTKKGDLYGDLWVIVRDANGVPILYQWFDTDGDGVNDTPAISSTGFPQPIAADGSLIPLDSEGAPINATLVQAVELGRTSVSRSPDKVLQQSFDTVLAEINAPGAVITLDASGRLVVNGDTVDSPLENLALYLKTLNPTALTGTITATLPTGFNPAALLAAAADKGDTINVDYVVYLNSILGVNKVTDGVTTSYYDFSTYNYDRTTTWSSATATVLVLKDGVYVPTVVNLYDTLFKTTSDPTGVWTDPTPTGGADDFAQATDDYLKVITYLHDNSIPE